MLGFKEVCQQFQCRNHYKKQVNYFCKDGACKNKGFFCAECLDSHSSHKDKFYNLFTIQNALDIFTAKGFEVFDKKLKESAEKAKNDFIHMIDQFTISSKQKIKDEILQFSFPEILKLNQQLNSPIDYLDSLGSLVDQCLALTQMKNQDIVLKNSDQIWIEENYRIYLNNYLTKLSNTNNRAAAELGIEMSLLKISQKQDDTLSQILNAESEDKKFGDDDELERKRNFTYSQQRLIEQYEGNYVKTGQSDCIIVQSLLKKKVRLAGFQLYEITEWPQNGEISATLNFYQSSRPEQEFLIQSINLVVKKIGLTVMNRMFDVILQIKDSPDLQPLCHYLFEIHWDQRDQEFYSFKGEKQTEKLKDFEYYSCTDKIFNDLQNNTWDDEGQYPILVYEDAY